MAFSQALHFCRVAIKEPLVHTCRVTSRITLTNLGAIKRNRVIIIDHDIQPTSQILRLFTLKRRLVVDQGCYLFLMALNIQYFFQDIAKNIQYCWEFKKKNSLNLLVLFFYISKQQIIDIFKLTTYYELKLLSN